MESSQNRSHRGSRSPSVQRGALLAGPHLREIDRNSERTRRTSSAWPVSTRSISLARSIEPEKVRLQWHTWKRASPASGVGDDRLSKRFAVLCVATCDQGSPSSNAGAARYCETRGINHMVDHRREPRRPVRPHRLWHLESYFSRGHRACSELIFESTHHEVVRCDRAGWGTKESESSGTVGPILNPCGHQDEVSIGVRTEPLLAKDLPLCGAHGFAIGTRSTQLAPTSEPP